jgi:hypothetical protein
MVGTSRAKQPALTLPADAVKRGVQYEVHGHARPLRPHQGDNKRRLENFAGAFHADGAAHVVDPRLVEVRQHFDSSPAAIPQSHGRKLAAFHE